MPTKTKPFFGNVTFDCRTLDGDDTMTVEAMTEGGEYEPARWGGGPDNWAPDGSCDPDVLAVRFEDAEGRVTTLWGSAIPVDLRAGARAAWWNDFHTRNDAGDQDHDYLYD